jgi:hypothetical protein
MISDRIWAHKVQAWPSRPSAACQACRCSWGALGRRPNVTRGVSGSAADGSGRLRRHRAVVGSGCAPG